MFMGNFMKQECCWCLVLVLGGLWFQSALNAQERAISHAPIGVMGDHYHGKGEVMLSIRQTRMWMGGNRNGTTDLSDTKIIELANPYQMGNMSTKLSVVPQDMAMNMTMIGAMYAPSDAITLMGMAMFMTKSMDLHSYQGAMPMGGMGGMNRAKLGSFNTSSSDLAALSLSGLIKFYEGDNSRLHAQFGIQRSVGSNDSKDEVLTPMNMRVNMILPYGMQIGDASTSLISGLTYVRTANTTWVYGGQVRSQNTISNPTWNFGNTLSVTGWVQKEVVRKTALSFRATYHNEKAVEGRNSLIMAPVQTANPANYGGNTILLGVGLNQLVNIFPGDHADRIGIEVTFSMHQDLNGPQMKSGVSIQVGYQKSLN